MNTDDDFGSDASPWFCASARFYEERLGGRELVSVDRRDAFNFVIRKPDLGSSTVTDW